MEKILIRADYLLPGGENWDTISDAELLIEDGIVSYVGQRRNHPIGTVDRIIEGKNKLVMPGLINTHTHAAMTLFRGYADDMPLMDWLEQKIWPAEARLNMDDIYWGTMLAICEMIRGGTTCFADMYFHMGEVARACLESGIRASLAQGLIGIDGLQEGEKRLEASKELVAQWHGAGGLITIMLGPHAPYTCPPQYLEKVLAVAGALKVPMHIHLAETRGEVQDCLDSWGKRPIALMESIGLFTQPVLAAHCVHLSEDEIEILARRQVSIAHNPGSNLKLGSGIAPLVDLLEQGALVSLGTDGAASNNNLDMIEEMRSGCITGKRIQ
jgi:5-methylthioadenosine/S-adenosylhomocysteine deaminase